MILLDTHIWIWWVHGDRQLADSNKNFLQNNEEQGFGISIISCWEVAKLVQKKRLVLPLEIDEWLSLALNYPGVALLNLTPAIIIDSTRLPGNFHKDPVDELLVATSRVNDLPLMTADAKILNYPHARVWKANG